MEKLHPNATAKGYRGNFVCIDATSIGAISRTKTTNTPASCTDEVTVTDKRVKKSISRLNPEVFG